MLKVVYIGNRPKVLEVLKLNSKIDFLKAFIIEQPLVEDSGDSRIIRIQSKGQKELLVESLNKIDYDICISAGCSYILPLDKLDKNKLYINCHPSVLPFGRGRHPLNECFLSGNNVAGVTIHLMDESLDTGDILKQESFELTDEVDISLLYGFIFDLEAELLDVALCELINNKLYVKSIPQDGKGTYYTREETIREFTASKTTTQEILKNVRAFSSHNLGVLLKTKDMKMKLHSAELIINKFIIERYKNIKKGSVIFMNKDVALIKMSDGIIKTIKFSIVDKKNKTIYH